MTEQMTSEPKDVHGRETSPDAVFNALTVGLEQLLPGVVILTGGRDKRGAPVIECHQRTDEQQSMTDASIVRILKYLCRVPRFERQDLGISLVVDVRDVSEDVLQRMMSALRMLHDFDKSVIGMVYIITPKDGPIRVALSEQFKETQLYLQLPFKLMFELSELSNDIEPDQLTADLGGTLQYNHEEWIRFRLTIEPFITDCRSCAKSLKAAVSTEQPVEELFKKLRVDQLIQEAQRIVSRMCNPPPEWASLAWSPDYRGIIAYIEQLCGQLEHLRTNLNVVVKRSTKRAGSKSSVSSNSPQEAVENALEFIQTRGTVFLRELKDYEDSLGAARNLLEEFAEFETHAKGLCEAGKVAANDILSSSKVQGQHSVRSRQLLQHVEPFVASMADKRRHLETVVKLHELVNKAFSWSVGLSRFLGRQQVLSNASNKAMLDMLDECRSFHGNHSGLTAKEVVQLKGLAISLRHPRASTQADVAVIASEEADGRFTSRIELLERMQTRETQPSSVGTADVEFSSIDVTDSEEESDEEDTLVEAMSDDSTSVMSVSLTTEIAEVAKRERVATLTKAVSTDATVPDMTLRASDEQELLLQSNTWQQMAAAARLSTVSEDMTVVEDEGYEDELDDVDEPDSAATEGELATQAAMSKRRKMLMQELVDTEERYVEDLEFVCKNYVNAYLTSDLVPNSLRGKTNVIFGNITMLYDFNKNLFLPYLRKHANTPLKIGSCFIEFEQDLGRYSLYFKIMPQQEQILGESPAKDFFRTIQIKLNDPMGPLSFLIKPFQRMARYRQFLEGVKKYAPPGLHGKPADDLELALKQVSFQLRHGNDLLAVEALKGFDGSLVEQGLLILQDDFIVTSRKGSHKRRLFLFEEMLIFSKQKKPKNAGEVFDFKYALKTADMGLTESVKDSTCKFELWFRKQKKKDTYMLQAEKEEVKAEWVKEIHNILYRQISKLKEQAVRGSATSALAPTRDSMGQHTASYYSDPSSVLARSSVIEDHVSQSSTSTVMSDRWRMSKREIPPLGQTGSDRISGISALAGDQEDPPDENDSGSGLYFSSDKVLTGLPGDPYRCVREDSV